MTSFVIGVYCAPNSPGAQAAYRFVQAVLKKKHKISQIFFYESGITHADKPSDFQTLIAKKIKLGVCSSLKPRPTQKNIKPISLTQYIYAVIKSDRHVIFE